MDNRRLILLMVFGFSLVMLWEAWQKQSHPQPAPVAGTQAPAASGAAAVPAAPTAPPAAAVFH
ncbi:MAG TPA: membrane protein insertase YidC, partial [Rhodocyclaceae bacterium]|nr:membrane protein insertase YidC [Rhodocyclaceae bacterium]